MLLLTKEIAKKLPPLYANESAKAENVKVIWKLFNPTGAGRWYITEYDPDQKLAFGYVTGLAFDELGYISIEELENFQGFAGLGIERDAWWDDNTTLAQVMNGEVV